MKTVDFLAVSSVCGIGGLLFYAVGIQLGAAIGMAITLWLAGLCMLNYLNHGKPVPVILNPSGKR